MTTEARIRIARDFYTTSHSLKYIATKHKSSPSTVSRIAREVGQDGIEPEKDWLVIKVERKTISFAAEVLKRAGVRYDVPEKFELTEMVESKMKHI